MTGEPAGRMEPVAHIQPDPQSDLDTMVADLRAALAADEAAAREAARESSPVWHPNAGEADPEGGYRPDDGPGFASIGPFDVGLPPGTRHHITRHDPAQVLALVAAHREILDLLETAKADPDREHDPHVNGYIGGLNAAVTRLASAYADRDDESERST